MDGKTLRNAVRFAFRRVQVARLLKLRMTFVVISSGVPESWCDEVTKAFWGPQKGHKKKKNVDFCSWKVVQKRSYMHIIVYRSYS